MSAPWAAWVQQKRRRIIVGVGSDLKRDQRVVKDVLDYFGTSVDLHLVHVLVLPVGYFTLAGGQEHAARRRFEKSLAPLLLEHGVPFHLCVRHAAFSVFFAQPHSHYIGNALCAYASRVSAAALVVGGSGRQNLARSILLGSRVSSLVARHAAVPVVLVGRHGLRTALSPAEDEPAEDTGQQVLVAAAA